MNKIIKLLFAIMLLPILTACEKNTGGSDAVFIANFNFKVKFESPIGTNVLDSLQIQPMQDNDYDNHLDDLTVVYSNKNNDLKHWGDLDLRYCDTEGWGGLNPNFSFVGVGTVLHIGFVDISIYDTPNHKYPKRDEEYTVSLTSKKIYGDEKIHTIKFYVHIKGKAVYHTYKCEVDGKEQQIQWIDHEPKPGENTALQGAFLVVKVKP